MNKEFKNNSLVIVANHHNPSLISDYFLINSGIIDKEDQIDKNSSVLTPAFAKFTLFGNLDFNVIPEKLSITSPIGKRPYEIGKKYCDSLKFIKGTAIGINFDIELSDYPFAEWFGRMNLNTNVKCVEAKYIFKHSNIVISFMKNENALAKFNFHYQLPKDLSLGQIELNFVEEWTKNQTIIEEFLELSFN